jgi:hypothetical protein
MPVSRLETAPEVEAAAGIGRHHPQGGAGLWRCNLIKITARHASLFTGGAALVRLCACALLSLRLINF